MEANDDKERSMAPRYHATAQERAARFDNGGLDGAAVLLGFLMLLITAMLAAMVVLTWA